jgi:hypothetical protein
MSTGYDLVVICKKIFYVYPKATASSQGSNPCTATNQYKGGMPVNTGFRLFLFLHYLI